jgi:hypothetical protein
MDQPVASDQNEPVDLRPLLGDRSGDPIGGVAHDRDHGPTGLPDQLGDRIAVSLSPSRRRVDEQVHRLTGLGPGPTTLVHRNVRAVRR